MTIEMGVSLASRFVTTAKVLDSGRTHQSPQAKETDYVAKREAQAASKQQPAKTNEMDQQQKQLSDKDMSQAAKHLNELTQSIRRELQFAVDNDSGRTVISVIDQESGEKIRQIPPEEVLTMIALIKDSGAGLFREEA